MNYHRPVCVKCKCELTPERNGIGLLDMFNPSDESDEPEPQPQQIWRADLWGCPKCGSVTTQFVSDYKMSVEEK